MNQTTKLLFGFCTSIYAICAANHFKPLKNYSSLVNKSIISIITIINSFVIFQLRKQEIYENDIINEILTMFVDTSKHEDDIIWSIIMRFAHLYTIYKLINIILLQFAMHIKIAYITQIILKNTMPIKTITLLIG